MRLLDWERIPKYMTHLFAREARAERAEAQQVPRETPRLEAGQRVEFDVHPGVDGPTYATNVRLIDDAAEDD
ncbi:MAG: hypothetical protein WBW32_05835 [Luteibacter sp.]